MSANPRVVLPLLTLKCGSPLDAVHSRRDEAGRKDSKYRYSTGFLQESELRQLEIDEVEKLEEVEEEGQEFQPEEDCAGATTPLTSEGTFTFSGGLIVSEDKVVSLVYRLLCHPRLERLTEFACYKAGYLSTVADVALKTRVERHSRKTSAHVMSQDVKKL